MSRTMQSSIRWARRVARQGGVPWARLVVLDEAGLEAWSSRPMDPFDAEQAAELVVKCYPGHTVELEEVEP